MFHLAVMLYALFVYFIEANTQYKQVVKNNRMDNSLVLRKSLQNKSGSNIIMEGVKYCLKENSSAPMLSYKIFGCPK